MEIWPAASTVGTTKSVKQQLIISEYQSFASCLFIQNSSNQAMIHQQIHKYNCENEYSVLRGWNHSMDHK